MRKSNTLSSKALSRIKNESLGTTRGPYKKKEKTAFEKVYDGLIDLDYTPFATRDGNIYISRKYEKNLEKARKLLRELGADFKETESRGRNIITINIPKHEQERTLESKSKRRVVK